ncbi:hypothetical protein NEOLEDRAFT_1183474 [Neolentinus lepideus HHB14362 ss-1]|uniref:Uncharacterized protein n=1 Tax=Neolentinus lepideus HHB14362 ss-1 TaxID=1314782 RepID=A0A165N8G2_9AGAM|nr:hypothetical protein NEOLEDRAFT_1183474 [Neolentinus lepideus HHB14362 ss-1]
MCARVAFLHCVLAENANISDYWGEVDKLLVALRNKYSNDAAKLSKCFGRILTADHKIYGDVEMDNLLKNARSPAQEETESIVTGGVIAGAGGTLEGPEHDDEE